MNNKKALVLALGAAMGLGVAATSVHAATLTSLVITGGTFALGPVFTPVPNVITNFSGANLIGPAIAPTFDTTVGQSGPAASSPMAWDFNGGGSWVNSFTTGPSSGDETGGVMTGTIDITINWYGYNFAQSNNFTGTGDGSNFSIAWTALAVGGAIDGQTGTYNVTGTYSVVPVPAAAWLMGSGLLGLVGIARRRKAQA